jgi:hypothetical protein
VTLKVLVATSACEGRRTVALTASLLHYCAAAAYNYRGCLHEPIRPEDHPPADQSALQSLLLMAQRSMGKDPTLPDEVAGTELMDRMGRLPNRLNAFRYRCAT